jgi:hypothetical protein
MGNFAVRSIAVAALLIACQRHPGTTETTEDPAGLRASPAAGRRFQAEVVSTNPSAQMITVRPSSSGDQPAGTGAVETALPVQGQAAGMLGTLRSGDRVVLTCEAVSETPAAGGAADRGREPESPPETGLDAGALGAPCPSVIRIEKVG